MHETKFLWFSLPGENCKYATAYIRVWGGVIASETIKTGDLVIIAADANVTDRNGLDFELRSCRLV